MTDSHAHCVHVFKDATRSSSEFTAKTDRTPTRAAAIAGSLQYREYDFSTRQLMRLLMKHMGHDTSHDYDYTDWERVGRLGAEFAALAAGSKVG